MAEGAPALARGRLFPESGKGVPRDVQYSVFDTKGFFRPAFPADHGRSFTLELFDSSRLVTGPVTYVESGDDCCAWFGVHHSG